MTPLITIITITYNAGRFLERTMLSVARQQVLDWSEIDYLVIDGGSTDNTLDIVQQYQSIVSHWQSEPDQGLYDAMNKGQNLAQGQYLWFMNAGDELHDEQVLPRLLERIRATRADVYYSDALFVHNNGSTEGLRSQVTPHTLPKHLRWQDMALGMKVCHQAFVARKTITTAYRLDNLSADLDWEINCLKNAQTIEHLDFVLCKYLMGGLSVQQHRKSLTDRFNVLAHHFGWLATSLNHLWILWRAYRHKQSRGS